MTRKNEATLEYVTADTPRENAVPILLARLLLKCKLTASGCWEYQGHKNSIGYGEATFAGKRYVVHRFMYEALLTGNLLPPRGQDICHSCHNRACVNPYHIRQDSHSANLLESAAEKRLQGQWKTHCKRGHPLSGNNLLKGKQFRVCAICSRGRYRLRLGWPEHLAFADVILPPGYMLDRKTGEIVPATRSATTQLKR